MEENCEDKIVVKKDWKPIWIYIICNCILPFVIVIGIFVVNYKTNIKINIESNIEKITFILQFIAIFSAFFVLIFIYRKLLKDGLKGLNKKNVLKISGTTIIVILINYITCELFERYNIKMLNQDLVDNMFESYPVLTGLSIIIAPISEELLFRYSLKSIIKNDIIFIIISSLIFGILHGIGIVTILYVLIGVYLSVVYLKTDKNIMAPILAHFLNNVIGLIIMFI